MSKYTTEVRFICEQQSGLRESLGYNDVGEIIEKARPKIFDFPYPIFDQNYKAVLESKILMHYYTREISEETYGLWKLRVRARLNEIMPYYNKLYESELIEFNPLWDTDITTDRDIKDDKQHANTTVDDFTNKKTGTVKTETDGQDVSQAGGQNGRTVNSADKTNTWDLYSDTPQGGINGILGAEDSPSLGSNGYLTNARHIIGDTAGSTSNATDTYGRTDTTNYGKITDNIYNTNDKVDGTRKNSGTENGTIDYLERVTGYRGRSPIESIMKLRDSFINIDKMIIKELRDLFFNLW